MKADPAFRRHSVEAKAFNLLSLLHDVGHASRADACELLGWSEHDFRVALAYARDAICPELGLAIPHPIPTDGFVYRLTGEWISVDGTPAIEAGTAYAMGQIESRLRAVHRDVAIAVRNLGNDSIGGRKARVVEKHLARVFQSLAEIDGPLPQKVSA